LILTRESIMGSTMTLRRATTKQPQSWPGSARSTFLIDTSEADFLYSVVDRGNPHSGNRLASVTRSNLSAWRIQDNRLSPWEPQEMQSSVCNGLCAVLPISGLQLTAYSILNLKLQLKISKAAPVWSLMELWVH